MPKLLSFLLLLLVGALSLGACCMQVEHTSCFAWPTDDPCPTRDEAEANQLRDVVDEVTSDATYWPAHAYTIEGEVTSIAAECCYQALVTECPR